MSNFKIKLSIAPSLLTVLAPWGRKTFATAGILVAFSVFSYGARAEVSPIAGTLTSPGKAFKADLNRTQRNIARVIEKTCPGGPGINSVAFQARCDGLVKAAPNGPHDGKGTGLDNAFHQISPEQIISQGTGATRTSMSAIGGRLASLRAGVRGFQISGLQYDGQSSLASLTPWPQSGGSAGDASDEIWDRLGVFVNGNFNSSRLDSSRNQLGYRANAGNISAGIDYRVSRDVIVGSAFTYTHTESDFTRNGGSLSSDAYSGSVYATFYASDAWYLDGVATVGGIDFDSSRHIRYKVPRDKRSPLPVDTNTTASPTGNQYSISVGSGYNWAINQWTLNPYARVSYTRVDLDAFKENGGAGWAMGFKEQAVDSLTTTLGGQASYTFSTPWGILIPSLRGEWYHQYKDSRRKISGYFLGQHSCTDAEGNGHRCSSITFNTFTDAPDRNYFVVGTGVSGTFAGGLTAFVSYDALLGYQNVDSHLFSAGVRLEF